MGPSNFCKVLTNKYNIMMDEERQINVTIEKYEGEKPIEIILRQGEAMKQAALTKRHEYEPVDIKGNISAPGNYLEKRLGKYFPHDSILGISRDQNGMTLSLNFSDACPSIPEDAQYAFNPRRQQIGGQLELGDMYRKLKINVEDYWWNPQKLAAFLRLNAHIFVNDEAGAKLVSALKNIKGRLEGEFIKQKDSGDGVMNRQEFYAEHISHNLPNSIELKLALIKGEPEQTYTVEFDCDYVDGNIRVQMVSASINGEWEKTRDAKIDAEVQRILALDPNIAVIEL